MGLIVVFVAYQIITGLNAFEMPKSTGSGLYGCNGLCRMKRDWIYFVPIFSFAFCLTVHVGWTVYRRQREDYDPYPEVDERTFLEEVTDRVAELDFSHAEPDFGDCEMINRGWKCPTCNVRTPYILCLLSASIILCLCLIIFNQFNQWTF